jgi:hypothetical protein
MDSQKTEILLAVHAAHKEELIYRRRAEYVSMALAVIVFAGGSTLLLLLHPASRLGDPGPYKALGTIGLVLIADMLCYALVKNYNRTCELQRVIVGIDAALGLFTPGEYGEGTIYPEEWKKSGAKRLASSLSRVFIVGFLAFLSILALWMGK